MFRNTEIGSEQRIIGFRSTNIGKERRQVRQVQDYSKQQGEQSRRKLKSERKKIEENKNDESIGKGM